MSPEKVVVSPSYMALALPKKFCCKPQNGQLAPKSPIFKMAENHHDTHFDMWSENSNAYNLYIVAKDILSGLILS